MGGRFCSTSGKCISFECIPHLGGFVLKDIKLGPVVQSVVSLMSSLRSQLVKCFTTYTEPHIPNHIYRFFC